MGPIMVSVTESVQAGSTLPLRWSMSANRANRRPAGVRCASKKGKAWTFKQSGADQDVSSLHVH